MNRFRKNEVRILENEMRGIELNASKESDRLLRRYRRMKQLEVGLLFLCIALGIFIAGPQPVIFILALFVLPVLLAIASTGYGLSGWIWDQRRHRLNQNVAMTKIGVIAHLNKVSEDSILAPTVGPETCAEAGHHYGDQTFSMYGAEFKVCDGCGRTEFSHNVGAFTLVELGKGEG
jgi:hypothetical protein